MAPESRNKSSNPIQRLLETEEKGRGLALFGWAGVTVFAFLAAFASWQFAPARAVSQLARLEDTSPGEITGGIRPAAHPINGRVPTVPTPLPDVASISKDDVDQLRADLKDLRRMVGRIDVSTDVLARRISNLEDSVGTGQAASAKPVAKPLQALIPVTPTMSVTPPGPVVSAMPPAPAVSVNPALPPSNAPSSTPGPAASNPLSPAAPVVVPSAQPAQQPVATVPQPGNVGPQSPPHPEASVQPHPPVPPDQQLEKSAFDRNAIDRSSLERMLMQRAQGLDPDNGSDANTYIPPLPDPISVVPKTRPLVMPPQPLPTPPSQPLAKAEPKPLPDATTTGSVAPRPVMPIDPTKAVVISPPVAPPEMAKPASPKPEVSTVEMSPEDQKKASEKMALAMRGEQPAATKPAEAMGIDLGGYKSIGQVKKVWSDLELRQGKLAKALTPLARLSEATDGVEIRLVAGPFLDKEQAMRTCRQLRGATAKCDTVAYAGEPILTKPTPEVEHKPSAPEFATRPPLKLDLPAKPLSPTIPTTPTP